MFGMRKSEWVRKKYNHNFIEFRKTNENGHIVICGTGTNLNNAAIYYHEKDGTIANSTSPSMIVMDGTSIYFDHNCHSKPFEQSSRICLATNTSYYFPDLRNFCDKKVTSLDLIQLAKVPDLDGYILADAMEETGFDAQEVFTYLRKDPLEAIEFLQIDPKDKVLFKAMQRVNANIKHVLEFTKKKVIQDIQDFYKQ